MQVATVDRTKDWTVDDYLLLGETTMPCQLINGELIMSPAPKPIHQKISRQLFRIIDKATNGKGELLYAPLDLYIDNKNVYQPDLIYLSEENKKFITHRGIEGAADLIIEIISPSNGYTDRNQKKSGYQRLGIQEYWIVDPGNETIEIYRLDKNSEVPVLYLAGSGEVTSTIIGDLNFDLSELFPKG